MFEDSKLYSAVFQESQFVATGRMYRREISYCHQFNFPPDYLRRHGYS